MVYERLLDAGSACHQLDAWSGCRQLDDSESLMEAAAWLEL